MTNEETIDSLNHLIQVCKDGEEGYRTAAGDVKNTELETVFLESSKQRGSYARELEAEVVRLGGTAVDSGSLSAALHRGWMDLKSGLSGGDSGAIVAACETGDDAAQAAFESVVNGDISGKTRAIVEKHWSQIKEAHARLLRLKNEIANGSGYVQKPASTPS